ncbi:MAG: MBOAT family protein [Alistipes sp.]|nr:MBOAT family protein [Alistipes sp.]
MEFFKFDEYVWERLLALLQYDSTAPMTFTSGFFLFAFFIVGLGYMAVRRKVTLRTIYVILVSLYFYYKISGLYVLLLLGVAISDFLIGGRVANRVRQGRGAKGWVALSLFINIGILVYFKVSGLFEQLINNLFDGAMLDIAAAAIPAGVSFFIFQSMSYIIDISRGVISPVKRFIDYLFLLSFFPKIFLGPLVRNKEFIPQIESDNLPVTREDIGRASILISRGLIKYAVIAKAIDSLLLIPATAGEFGDSGVVMLVALLAFGIRLYCDFSGFSDIAIGIALVMGYKLPDNFDAPFKSATITEFWRRWHISLSTWLRDYVYISLGGNRKGRLRQYFNLAMTMFVCAMWHKVNLPYVVWGLLQGCGLALHKIWVEYVPGAKILGKDMTPVRRILGTLFCFAFITATWPMICCDNWEAVSVIYTRIFTNFAAADFMQLTHKAGFALVLVLIGYFIHFLPKSFNDLAIKAATRLGLVGQLIILVVAIWLSAQCQLMLAGDGGGLPVYAAF